MKNDKKIIMSIIWLLIGMVLFALGLAEIVDEFWSSLGSALIVVGILQMVRFHRLRKDPDYRESLEIEAMDERNRFIRNKAWAWAGYLFILIVSVSIIIFKVLGQDLLSMAASFAVCFMMILYWGAYLVLRKKY